MTLKERLKQLKAGADHQAAELGHENAAGAAKAGGRVAGGLLWKATKGTATLAGTLVLRMAAGNSKESDNSSWTDSVEWREGPQGYGAYSKSTGGRVA